MRTVNRTAMVFSTLPLVVLALSAVSSQAGALDPADWTTFHFDNAHSPGPTWAGHGLTAPPWPASRVS